MTDLDELRALTERSLDAWNRLDADAVMATGGGEGFGYRARDARSRSREDAEETRRRVAAVLGTYEYFRIRDLDWHGRVDGDLAILWGFFTEEFQNKGFPPEERRVRFSNVYRRGTEGWTRLWEHRDAQPFDDDGRYLRHPSS